MSSKPAFEEDLRQIAGEAYALSGQLCGTCADMHALWPYIRLARASTGIEDEGSRLERVLSELIRQGRREVLIAGAQDTGLLTLVARASPEANIVVLDQCETPLELCRRLARRNALAISTLHTDLRDLEVVARFNLILVHFTLHFIEPAHRIDVLMRLRRALKPGGRLALLFNTGRKIGGALMSQGREGYAHWVMDELDRLTVPLPEPADAFGARLSRHGGRREDREGAYATPDEVCGLLRKAGFDVCDCFETTATVADPLRDFVAKIDKRRFLAVAAPADKG
jgi:SAM-dependent methyltransferase